jgi:hypothetical protein
VGMHRSYFQWDDLGDERRTIRDDHAHRRLPWVSFKPPSTSGGGWLAVASGRHDGDLRRRAAAYAELDGPVVLTFHHEPSNDHTGTPQEYADAWVHVHDVMRAEAGLRNVAFVPIIDEWEWNPVNDERDPRRWLPDQLLDRAAFLGVDLYQDPTGEGLPERLARVLSWLSGIGRSRMMLGLGETACTDRFGSPTAAQWWTRSWRWVERWTDRVAVVGYYNTQLNAKGDVYWPLDESPEKLAAYRRSLDSPRSCLLR